MCGTREPLQGLTSSKIRMPLSAKSKEVSVHKPRERSEGVGVGEGTQYSPIPVCMCITLTRRRDTIVTLFRDYHARHRRWKEGGGCYL